MIRRLLALFHRHRWLPTKHNAYGTAIEEGCRCGQYRHYFFRDRRGISSEPAWRSGRLPTARPQTTASHSPSTSPPTEA